MTRNPRYKDNLILKLTFEFSIEVMKYCDQLEVMNKKNVAHQLFRCGTSIGANAKEAQNSESKADFVHKLKIALKEADETEYWLLLCSEFKNYPDSSELINKLTSIIKILNKIISSTRTISITKSN
jgi:four helix bundle protein